jgi:hypothetical protein
MKGMALWVGAAALVLAARSSMSGQLDADPPQAVPAASQQPAIQKPLAPAPKAVSTQPSAPAMAKAARIYGTVASYDSASNRIVIKTKSGRSVNYMVTPGAKITRGGTWKAVSQTDIKAGQHVEMMKQGDQIGTIHIQIRK